MKTLQFASFSSSKPMKKNTKVRSMYVCISRRYPSRALAYREIVAIKCRHQVMPVKRNMPMICDNNVAD